MGIARARGGEVGGLGRPTFAGQAAKGATGGRQRRMGWRGPMRPARRTVDVPLAFGSRSVKWPTAQRPTSAAVGPPAAARCRK